jgi:hypothetical protein
MGELGKFTQAVGVNRQQKPKRQLELRPAPVLPRGPDHWLSSLKTKYHLKAASDAVRSW